MAAPTPTPADVALTVRMFTGFMGWLHADPECRCNHFAHPNDPDEGGLCAHCEEQSWREDNGQTDADLEAAINDFNPMEA